MTFDADAVLYADVVFVMLLQVCGASFGGCFIHRGIKTHSSTTTVQQSSDTSQWGVVAGRRYLCSCIPSRSGLRLWYCFQNVESCMLAAELIRGMCSLAQLALLTKKVVAL